MTEHEQLVKIRAIIVGEEPPMADDEPEIVRLVYQLKKRYYAIVGIVETDDEYP